MKHKMTSFIYFDIGGVVINDLNQDNGWETMKQDLGVTLGTNRKFDNAYDNFEIETCVGRNVEDFIPIMEKEFSISIKPGYSMLDDFVNRFEHNKSIWPIIEKAREKYQIGLLTNMYPGMLNAIQARNLLPLIKWDIIIDSSVEKMQKPNTEIYELAEKRSGFTGKEILFIDNTKKNLDAASKLDWNTFLYNPKNPKLSNRKLTAII